MPIIGLRSLLGTEIRWGDIDPVKDADLFRCSPATLQFLKNDQSKRTDVPTDSITASEYDKGDRLRYLERNVEVFSTVEALIPAFTGTMKHDVTQLDNYDKIVAEHRFHIEWKGIKISAKIDHAAEVDWDHELNRPLWDLYDLKTGGLYAAKKYIEDPFGDKKGYTYQVNLAAAIIEETNLATIRYQWIEWYPRDIKRNQRDKAVMMIAVPPMDRTGVLDAYADKEFVQRICETGPPEFCTPAERWERHDWKSKRVESVRCADYCEYLDACRDLTPITQQHPLDKEENAA